MPQEQAETEPAMEPRVLSGQLWAATGLDIRAHCGTSVNDNQVSPEKRLKNGSKRRGLNGWSGRRGCSASSDRM
jgi:hypothetical protein